MTTADKIRTLIEPLFEDTAVNLPPAAALGMTTVLVVPPAAEALAPDADPAPGRRLPDADIHFVTDDLIGWLRGAAERRANSVKSLPSPTLRPGSKRRPF